MMNRQGPKGHQGRQSLVSFLSFASFESLTLHFFARARERNRVS
jgi:hypothetical protein